MKKKFIKISGITLLEMLIGIVISSIMMGALYTSYTVVNGSYTQVADKETMSRTGRDIVGMLLRDIRMAGYHDVDSIKVTTKDAKLWKIAVLDMLKKRKWNNKKPTAQMLGRYQPWHEGHRKLFECIVKKDLQVNIQVKDSHGLDKKNPFPFKKVKNFIKSDLEYFKSRIKITKMPNITNIFYGRKVGYKIEKILTPKKYRDISATKIRSRLKK